MVSKDATKVAECLTAWIGLITVGLQFLQTLLPVILGLVLLILPVWVPDIIVHVPIVWATIC